MKKLLVLLSASFFGMLIVSCSDNPVVPEQLNNFSGTWFINWENENLLDTDIIIDFKDNSNLIFDNENFVGSWNIDSDIAKTFYFGKSLNTDMNNKAQEITLLLSLIDKTNGSGKLTVKYLNNNEEYFSNFTITKVK